MKKTLNVAMVVFTQTEEGLFKRCLVENLGESHQLSGDSLETFDDKKNSVKVDTKVLRADSDISDLCQQENQLFLLVVDIAEEFENAPDSVREVLNRINKINEKPIKSSALAIINVKQNGLAFEKLKQIVAGEMSPTRGYDSSFFTEKNCYTVDLDTPGSVKEVSLEIVKKYHQAKQKETNQLHRNIKNYAFLAIGTLAVGGSIFGIIANCGLIAAAKLAPLCLIIGGVMVPHITIAVAALLLLSMVGFAAHHAYHHYQQRHLFSNYKISVSEDITPHAQNTI